MKKVINFTVNSEDKGKRLDIFLSEKMNNTRSEIKKMIDKELVLLNDKLPKKAGQSLKVGSNIKILEEKFKLGVDFTKKIKIIKDTNDYIIIDKPSGLLVHPTDRNEVNTLTDWLLSEYSQVKGVGESVDRPGIVHRLDKEASGVMVIAKNKKMFEHLKKQFKDRTISKYYTVLVHGILDMKHDKIDFDINRGHDGKMVARPKIDNFKVKNVGKEQEGREALTEYWVEKEYTRFSLLKVKIHTGRTHQIRVHMLAYAHPVVGDSLHFNKKLNRKKDEKLGRIFLHASELCFEDLQGKKVCYNSNLPKKLKDFIKELN